jgi:hypothetical protein
MNSVVMLNVFMLKVVLLECLFFILSVVMLTLAILSVVMLDCQIFYCHVESRYTERCYD